MRWHRRATDFCGWEPRRDWCALTEARLRCSTTNSSPALPSGDIRCLLAASDGALWVGTSEGLARWKDGVARTFTRRDGLPGDSVLTLTEGADGVLWVGTDQGQAGLKGERFVPGSPAPATKSLQPPFPMDGIEMVQTFPGGTALASKSEVVVLRSGAAPMRLRTGHEIPGSRIQTLVSDREGCLWIGTNGGLARLVDGKMQCCR